MSKRTLLGLLILVVAAVGFVISTRSQPSQPGFEVTATSEEITTTHLVKIGEHSYVVEVAATVEEQSQGLSNRETLPENAGMLFPFNPPRVVPFWMKDMRFPLDIIWIDEDNKIIGIEKNAPAPREGTETSDLPSYSPPGPIRYVLELNAGQSQHFKVGDSVTISEIQAL